jgi:predicted phosphodiesterase
VAVLGLNSAWLCYGGEEDFRRILLGGPQAIEALEATREADIRIALLHHPFDWLVKFDRDDVESELRNGCHLILHGHLHEPQVRVEATLDGETVITPAGAAYESRDYANSYNFVRLDLTAGRGTVYLRRYNDKRREWVKDIESTGEERDGRFEFDLPKQLASKIAVMPSQQAIVIRSIETGKSYLVEDGKRRYIPDNPTLRAVVKLLGVKEVRELSNREVNEYPLGDPLPSQASRVVQDSREIKYLVASREKRRIPNEETLKALGGDPRHVPTEADEHLASYQEGSPLPEQLGAQWFTSTPRLVRVEAAYTAVFLVRGSICRYIPKRAFVEEIKRRLQMIGPEERIDERKLESYVEGIPIESTRDIRTALEDRLRTRQQRRIQRILDLGLGVLGGGVTEANYAYGNGWAGLAGGQMAWIEF